MNGLDIFADFDDIHDDGLDSYHVTDEGMAVELKFWLDVLFFFGLQCLNSCSNLLNQSGNW